MHAFFSSCFQIDCWFHLVCCICCFVKLGSFLHKWIWLSFYKCRSRKIQDYLAINSTGVFQKAVAYMKICCIYEKQYTRSYIVRYRFLIFLNRIFPHLPFTSMLAKRSFLCLFRTQKDNTEKLFFSSFGEFGKICDLWCLVWPHAKIYHGLMAASPLSSVQIEWTAEGSDERPGGAQEIWKWRVGIRHSTSGVCSANQDIKPSFVLCDTSARGWYEFMSFSAAVVLPLLSLSH